MTTECLNLLLLCARPTLATLDSERLSLLAEGVEDWNILIQQAQNHRITPLLYKHLNRHCPASVPESAMQHIQHLFIANMNRNIFLIEAMAEVLEILKSNNITTLVFKGPALAVDAFGNPDMRQFDDIDLIIPKDQILKAQEILIAENYEPQLSLSPNQVKAYLQSQRDWVFIHKKTGVILDINSTITPRYFQVPFPSDLHTSSRTISIAGHKANTLSVENLLQTLLVHGTYHQWTRLSWLSDVAALLKTHHDINWSNIHKQSDKMHCKRMVNLGLLLADNLLQTKIPENIKEKALNDPATVKLRDQIEERFTTVEDISQSTVRKYYFHISVRERFIDKLLYIIRFVFVPTISDWQFIKIPGALWVLYYLIRPFRIILKASLARLNAPPSPPLRD